MTDIYPADDARPEYDGPAKANGALNGDSATSQLKADVAEVLRQKREEARAWTHDRCETARASVTAEPVKTLVIAAGLGLLIGFLVRGNGNAKHRHRDDD